ncbi:MAG: hypothetical protein SYR96_11985, partial [Actinomycetota bacterium]|nr:hypothetical protein [Actinomycetota bacterium]
MAGASIMSAAGVFPSAACRAAAAEAALETRARLVDEFLAVEAARGVLAARVARSRVVPASLVLLRLPAGTPADRLPPRATTGLNPATLATGERGAAFGADPSVPVRPGDRDAVAVLALFTADAALAALLVAALAAVLATVLAAVAVLAAVFFTAALFAVVAFAAALLAAKASAAK